jgi:hypothetical protein
MTEHMYNATLYNARHIYIPINQHFIETLKIHWLTVHEVKTNSKCNRHCIILIDCVYQEIFFSAI